MGWTKQTNKILEQLLSEDPTYTRSKFPGMQLGMANNVLNSQMPGTQQFQRNIASTGQTSFNNAAKYATDASQLLGINAGIQGQTDQQLSDLKLQQADWKKFGLQNLNNAYGVNQQEDQTVFGDTLRKYGNKVQIKGQEQQNKLAKLKTIMNAVMGMANLGVSAMTGGFGGGGGLGGSPSIGGPV